MTKIIKSYAMNEELIIRLERVSRLLNKSMSEIVNELIEKGLTEEAIINEIKLQDAQRKITLAQLKLSES